MIELADDFIVTISDVRKTGHCPAGIRRWFTSHDLDFVDFLANGVSARVLLDTNDALADDVVRKVMERRNG